MPTVPNWIAKAVVVVPSFSRLDTGDVYEVKDWRATTTQVVVTLDDPRRTEVRFYLDGLHGVGKDSRVKLLDPASPDAMEKVTRIRADKAVQALETEMALARLDYSRDNPSELVEKIDRIQRVATEALARLGDLL